MFAELSQWRMITPVDAIGEGDQSNRVLPFVQGLYFSALIIYALRECLGEPGIEVSWGHLLDTEGEYISRECDIIVHRKDRHAFRWNGHEHPVMDFRFIPCDQALAVVSCKSFLQLKHLDRKYPRQMEPFAQKIALFAECCKGTELDRLKKAALNCGYMGMWYVYTRTESGVNTRDPAVWLDFLKAIKSTVT
jgi:hypothetical protein